MSLMVDTKSTPKKDGFDYGYVGTDGGNKIIEVSERPDRRWKVQSMSQAE